MSKVEHCLEKMGISLTETPKALARYCTVQHTGNLIFTSGGGPIKDGKILYRGKVGSDLTLQEGKEAARQSAFYMLSLIKGFLGDLDRVEKIIKVTAFVASAPDFYDQPLVVDGFSEVMEEVFGACGKHARTAIAVPQLPFNTPVEVDMVVEVN